MQYILVNFFSDQVISIDSSLVFGFVSNENSCDMFDTLLLLPELQTLFFTYTMV